MTLPSADMATEAHTSLGRPLVAHTAPEFVERYMGKGLFALGKATRTFPFDELANETQVRPGALVCTQFCACTGQAIASRQTAMDTREKSLVGVLMCPWMKSE